MPESEGVLLIYRLAREHFLTKASISPLWARPGGQASGEGERDSAHALPTTLISWGMITGGVIGFATNQKTKERDLHESYNISVRAVLIRR